MCVAMPMKIAWYLFHAIIFLCFITDLYNIERFLFPDVINDVLQYNMIQALLFRVYPNVRGVREDGGY